MTLLDVDGNRVSLSGMIVYNFSGNAAAAVNAASAAPPHSLGIRLKKNQGEY